MIPNQRQHRRQLITEYKEPGEPYPIGKILRVLFSLPESVCKRVTQNRQIVRNTHGNRQSESEPILSHALTRPVWECIVTAADRMLCAIRQNDSGGGITGNVGG